MNATELRKRVDERMSYLSEVNLKEYKAILSEINKSIDKLTENKYEVTFILYSKISIGVLKQLEKDGLTIEMFEFQSGHNEYNYKIKVKF